MIHNKIIVMAVLFLGGVAYAMEKEENNELMAIQKWQDVTPFAGKFVAYKATSSYLDSKIYKYVFPSSDLSYGYVQDFVFPYYRCGNAYDLAQLLKKDGVPNTMALADKVLRKGSLQMRGITSREAEQIIEVLNSKEAKFAYYSGDREQKIIFQLQLIAENKV